MKGTKNNFFTLNSKRKLTNRVRIFVLIFAVIFTASSVFFSAFSGKAKAQTIVVPTTVINSAPVNFRVGERLTYNFSFEKFNNIAYAETYVVSRGSLSGFDAVELESKFRTLDFFSAAFYLLDEKRTTFASADTGLPLYVRHTTGSGGTPLVNVSNFLVAPTTSYDLLSLLYQVRRHAGVGAYNLQEDGRIYNINFQLAGNERVKTDWAQFDTAISNVQSDYFAEKGITNVRVNFSLDDQRLPVLIRFRTARGEFRGELASIQLLEETNIPMPTITPTPTPIVIVTPTPTATPYVDNKPLLPELPFRLGETLEYQISNNGLKIGTVIVQAGERKLVQNRDTLLLTAKVTAVEPGNQLLTLGDTIIADVDPDTLAPRKIELKFSPAYAAYSQNIFFDQDTGTAIFTGARSAQIPVGTHSLLSLVYAIRSFNLKPSKDPKNPVNDTRVAVFLDEKAYIFILRPSDGEIINLKAEKVPAQQITIITGNPAIDRLSPRLWLGVGEDRLPLRLTIGSYQADLVQARTIPPQ